MTKKADLVEERFSQVNCAQTVFSLYAEDLGIDEETTLKIASGFGGGMKRGATCGAITGAYMVIGLKFGNTHNDSEEKLAYKEYLTQYTHQFANATIKKWWELGDLFFHKWARGF